MRQISLSAIVTAAALASLVAGEAQAHARLIQASPRAGETVAAPQRLRLQYSETIVPAASSVTVTGPGNVAVATGKLALDAKDKRVVLVPLAAALSAGAYKVVWKMKTSDGHTTDGGFGFTVKP